MFIACFVHKSFLVTKKKMLEAVCIGEQDVVFSVCSFSGFFVCYCYLFINDTTRLSNPVHGFRPFFGFMLLENHPFNVCDLSTLCHI